jgi:hypothetical protein
VRIVKVGTVSSTVIGKLYYLSQTAWNLATNTSVSTSSGLLVCALGTSSSVGMLVRGNSNLITSAFPIGDIIYQQMVILLMLLQQILVV